MRLDSPPARLPTGRFNGVGGLPRVVSCSRPASYRQAGDVFRGPGAGVRDRDLEIRKRATARGGAGDTHLQCGNRDDRRRTFLIAQTFSVTTSTQLCTWAWPPARSAHLDIARPGASMPKAHVSPAAFLHLAGGIRAKKLVRRPESCWWTVIDRDSTLPVLVTAVAKTISLLTGAFGGPVCDSAMAGASHSTVSHP